MVSTATGERSTGCAPGVPRGFLSVSNAGPTSEKHPHPGHSRTVCAHGLLSLWACLSAQEGWGSENSPAASDGTFVYLRLYCVCIPGAFRAWHQHPTPQASRRASIQTSQDFLADGEFSQETLFWLLSQNPSEQAVSPPTPSPLSPRPGRLQAQQQRLDVFGRTGRGDLATGLLGGQQAWLVGVRFLELPE